MIVSETLSASQMADVAGCSKRSIASIRSNVRYFGSTKAPPMLQALQDYLLEKLGQTLDEMALFLWDEFRLSFLLGV